MNLKVISTGGDGVSDTVSGDLSKIKEVCGRDVLVSSVKEYYG